MRQIFVFVLLIAAVSVAEAQEHSFRAPDYDLIKKEILDSSSVFYYPKLFARLIEYDTTLGKEEYRHLYFGYIFQKKYEPYYVSPDEEKLVKYYQSTGELTEKEINEIIEIATRSIDEYPFDMRQMNFLGYVYHLKGDEAKTTKIYYRFSMTIDAIMSSGDGKTCETAFHVTSVSHEYVLLNMFDFRMKSQALTGNCDYLTIEKDERNIRGIYFNVSKMLEINEAEMKIK
jgi:hypothetical protein